MTPREAAKECLSLMPAWQAWRTLMATTDDDDRLAAYTRCLAVLESTLHGYDRTLLAECRPDGVAA